MKQFPRHDHFTTAGPLAEVHSIFEACTAIPSRSVRIALIGTFAPRRCGIATFTADIADCLRRFHPEIGVDVHALDDSASSPPYRDVAGVIAVNDPEACARAAQRINQSGVDAVWLQHEYGIFGGDDGETVCGFVDGLAAPLVLTLHTVLGDPTSHQRAIMDHLLTRASRVMVMSNHSRDLLLTRYGVSADAIVVIPHGAPDRPFGRQHGFKTRLGLEGRKVLTTFGLLGPGKGLEAAIRALPAIVARHPQVVYRIVGATHPRLIDREGEAYRDKLAALAAELEVSDHLAWDNRFLEAGELLDQLEACDIYLMSYPGLDQSTSGTLSYAVALGKAVVSTPFAHARELLADGVGVLIEPGSHQAIATAVNRLLDAPDDLAAMQQRAYGHGRATIWPRFADASARLIASVLPPRSDTPMLDEPPSLAAVLAMSDGTGMMQHGVGVVPDWSHGYCLDDNARALMLMNLADGISAERRMRSTLAYAAFIQNAWNPDLRRFRNFMGHDRAWREQEGSEDSNGRAIWALGQTWERSTDRGLADWALRLYEHVEPGVSDEMPPRTIAFVMLGACAVLRRDPRHALSREIVRRGGEVLMCLLGAGRRPDWAWFEAMLSYDNPRLSQALIEAAVALDRPDWIDAGLDSLRWISARQVSAAGRFRPIGSETFGKPYASLPFDQQPLEAQAAIEAAGSAWRATGDLFWPDHALAAWHWFFGGNDRGAVLADMATGRCCDGVTPRGANINCGAESILAFQLSYQGMVELFRAAGIPAGTSRAGTPRAGTPREGGMLEQARDRLS